MSEKIKLSELVAARAAMTPGVYVRGQWQHEVVDGKLVWTKIAPDRDDDGSITVAAETYRAEDNGGIIGGCGCCGSPYGKAVDVDGLVATHNAADALIEFALADLAYRAASRERAKAGARWSQASDVVGQLSPDEPELYAEYQRTEDIALVAKARLDAARARFE